MIYRPKAMLADFFIRDHNVNQFSIKEVVQNVIETAPNW